MHAFSYMTLAV